jgi:hypothetical protein
MEWINVKDRLPSRLEEVLTFDGNSVSTADFYWFTDEPEPFFMCRGKIQVFPTHWMSLPSPPASKTP